MSDSFHIYTDISYIPAKKYETYLGEGFSGVCTGGSAVIEVFSVRRRIVRNDLVTILPLQLVSICDVSDDFSMTFFKVDKAMFLEIMSGLGKVTTDFFFYMRKNFQYHLSNNDTERFLGFCRAIDFRGKNDDPVFWHETILHLLRIYYWDFYVSFQTKTSNKKNYLRNSNKENIAFRFSVLVSENYKEHREIAFYAEKLCISPLYLTKVVREVKGLSAHEVIVDYVIVEIKTMLRDANLDIKDIVRQIGFANQSSLSRFFRQHTGLSPSEYRRTIHIIR